MSDQKQKSKKEPMPINLIPMVMLVISVISILLTQINSSKTSYASKESFMALNEKVRSNTQEISILKKNNQDTRSILCGIVIDMQLPSAKAECENHN